jgi:hypothetical protein
MTGATSQILLLSLWHMQGVRSEEHDTQDDDCCRGRPFHESRRDLQYEPAWADANCRIFWPLHDQFMNHVQHVPISFEMQDFDLH